MLLVRFAGHRGDPRRRGMGLLPLRLGAHAGDRMSRGYLPRCPVDRKVSYRTHTKALLALVEIVFDLEKQQPNRTKVPCRTYPCPHCGWWHLTSKPWEESHEARGLTTTANKVIESVHRVSRTPQSNRKYAHGTHR